MALLKPLQIPPIQMELLKPKLTSWSNESFNIYCKESVKILHGEVKTKLHHEANFIMKQTRKSPHLWLQEKSHQISTIHQLPHLILLTNGLQMSLHLFQICLLQLIVHRKKEPPHIIP
jgi:hypothetical protein